MQAEANRDVAEPPHGPLTNPITVLGDEHLIVFALASRVRHTLKQKFAERSLRGTTVIVPPSNYFTVATRTVQVSIGIGFIMEYNGHPWRRDVKMHQKAVEKTIRAIAYQFPSLLSLITRRIFLPPFEADPGSDLSIDLMCTKPVRCLAAAGILDRPHPIAFSDGLLSAAVAPLLEITLEFQLYVSIIGTEPLGCVLAADLCRRGHRALLWASGTRNDIYNAISTERCLKATGEIEGRFVPFLTTELACAVAFAKIIVIALPPHERSAIIAELAKLNLSKHTIVAIPGNSFGFNARQMIRARYFLETSAAPYECIWRGSNTVDTVFIKHTIDIASYPIPPPPDICGQLAQLFPRPLTWRTGGVFEIDLMCIDPLTRLPTLANSRRTDLPFFGSLTTVQYGELLMDIDHARLSIGEALHLTLPSLIETFGTWYGHSQSDNNTSAGRPTASQYVEFVHKILLPTMNRFTVPQGPNRILEGAADACRLWGDIASRRQIPSHILANIIVQSSIAKPLNNSAIEIAMNRLDTSKRKR